VFDSSGRTSTQGLRITEKLMKVLPLLCKRLDLVRMARMKIAAPSPEGDVKIVSSVSTFVLNTLTLK